MKYPLASSSWDSDEINAINDVILGNHFTMGDRVLDFETKFSSFFKSKYAVMTNSGSSSNLLMIAALRFMSQNPLKPGDEIIVPAVSWATTYAPLYQYGHHIKFVDIDLKTLNYDIACLEEAVSDKTKCIIAVNLLGNPNDYNEIIRIIGDRKIILIEDNCESMGAMYNENYAGTFGLMGSFSTFFSHHISTMEGGVVITDNEELYHILLALRAHGWTRNLPEQNLISKPSSDKFHEKFRFVLPGYNLRPTEINGAIGVEQLKKLPGIINNRINNSELFLNVISKYPVITQTEIGRSSWFGFSMIIDPDTDVSRQELLDVFKENNIEARPIVTGNFTHSESLKYYDYSIHGTLKNADILHDRGLFIGNHHYQLNNEIKHLDSVMQIIF